MADCRVCSAPIRWARTETGEQVPLDEHEQLDYGPKRYRIIEDGAPPVIAPVPDDSPARTFVDHREICQRPRAI